MKITKELVHKTAHLARLSISKEKESQTVEDLQKMVDWIEQLKEVDTEGVEPITHMSHAINRFRPDKVSSQVTTEKALKNAPNHNDKFFRVPKVINK